MPLFNQPHRLRLLALLAGFGYGLFYLFAIGDLDLIRPAYWDAWIAELSVERALQSRSPFLFEAVAVLEMGYLIWLISPLNLLFACLLGGLLAGNLHGAIYLHQHPRCQRPGQSGRTLASALPALLAGGACCAPSLLLLLGIPALGAFVSLFAWLLPVSVIALGLNRVWQHHKGAPRLLSLGRSTTVERAK